MWIGAKTTQRKQYNVWSENDLEIIFCSIFFVGKMGSVLLDKKRFLLVDKKPLYSRFMGMEEASKTKGACLFLSQDGS